MEELKVRIHKILNANSLKYIKKNQIIDICNLANISTEGTKSTLLSNIKEHPDLFCENKSDPVTLIDVADIQDKVIFKHNDKYFCFSKETISFMKATNVTKNPFCLDDNEYSNSDKWSLHDIPEFQDIPPKSLSLEDVPENITHRFDIENSTDMYITIYIDFLETLQEHNCKKVLTCIISNIQLHLYYVEGDVDGADSFNQLLIYLSSTNDSNLVIFKTLLSKMSDVQKSLFFLEFESMLVVN